MKSGMIARILVSIFLIGVGILALLINLDVIKLPGTISGGGVLWLVLFSLSGLAFLGIYLKSGDNWWAIIPGLTLIGLGIVISDIFPSAYQYISVVVLLALLGFSFLGAYLMHRSYWGLIFPVGLLLTAAAHTLIAETPIHEYSGTFLWLGFALTLFVVFWVSPGKSKWLLAPAIACVYLAIVTGAGAMLDVSIFLPGLLILLGGIVIWRAFRRPVRS